MLGHEPGDKNDAMRMNTRIHDLMALLQIGINQYYSEEVVEKQADLEDGVMRVVER